MGNTLIQSKINYKGFWKNGFVKVEEYPTIQMMKYIYDGYWKNNLPHGNGIFYF